MMKGLFLVVLVMAGTAAAALTFENGQLAHNAPAANKGEKMKKARFGAEMLTPTETFTKMAHTYMEKKHVENLARLGRKDARRDEGAVIAYPADADASAEVSRRGGPSVEVARPIFLELGERGCNHYGQPCEVGLSCQDNTCLGPAKAGESCNLEVSGYMCESGSYCQCTNAQKTSCTCTAEKKEGSCRYQNECAGGHLCNYDYSVDPFTGTGTCTAFGSVEDGGFAVDDILCEYGLYYDDMTGPDNAVCKEAGNTCVVDADCALTYSTSGGFATPMHSDGIYFTCSSGNCVNNGPNCKSGFSSLLAAARKETTNTYGEDESIDFGTVLGKLAKCLYADHVTDEHKGKPFPVQVNGEQSTGEYPFFYSNRWDDATWVAEGGDCTVPNTRCEVGLECRGGTCHYPNAEGESCAGNVDNRCVIGTYCFNETVCTAPLKKGEACFWEDDSLYGYDAYTMCRAGYDCNFATETTTGTKTRLDGVCTEYASVEDGGKVSSEDFCQYGLRAVEDSSGDFGVCRGVADETCSNFYDCDYYGWEYNLAGDYYDYDYDYYSDAPVYSWQYGFYQYRFVLDGQVSYCSSNTTNGRCVFNEDNKCHKLYSQLQTYLKGTDLQQLLPSYEVFACALSDCIYGDVLAKGYRTCNSAAGLLPAPLLLLVAVAMALFLH